MAALLPRVARRSRSIEPPTLSRRVCAELARGGSEYPPHRIGIRCCQQATCEAARLHSARGGRPLLPVLPCAIHSALRARWPRTMRPPCGAVSPKVCAPLPQWWQRRRPKRWRTPMASNCTTCSRASPRAPAPPRGAARAQCYWLTLLLSPLCVLFRARQAVRGHEGRGGAHTLGGAPLHAARLPPAPGARVSAAAPPPGGDIKRTWRCWHRSAGTPPARRQGRRAAAAAAAQPRRLDAPRSASPLSRARVPAAVHRAARRSRGGGGRAAGAARAAGAHRGRGGRAARGAQRGGYDALVHRIPPRGRGGGQDAALRDARVRGPPGCRHRGGRVDGGGAAGGLRRADVAAAPARALPQRTLRRGRRPEVLPAPPRQLRRRAARPTRRYAPRRRRRTSPPHVAVADAPRQTCCARCRPRTTPAAATRSTSTRCPRSRRTWSSPTSGARTPGRGSGRRRARRAPAARAGGASRPTTSSRCAPS